MTPRDLARWVRTLRPEAEWARRTTEAARLRMNARFAAAREATTATSVRR